MTNEELRRAMTRIDDARTERRAAIDRDARPPVTAADRIASPFAVGDRVQDLRGGREGKVTDVTPASPSGAVLVWVRFDDGSLIVRPPAALTARPRPPAARA